MAYLILDVDGYTFEGRSGCELCTWTSDGKRARECGFAFVHHGEYKQPIYEILYFYDPPEFTFIYKRASTSDGRIAWNATYITGMELDPAETRTRCHASPEAFKIIKERIEHYQQLCMPDPLMIMAKGGPELNWVYSMNLKGQVFYCDLSTFSCPTVESLAKLYNDTQNCGKHSRVRQRFASFRSFTRQAVHCPLLEVRLFLAWWLTVGLGIAMIRIHFLSFLTFVNQKKGQWRLKKAAKDQFIGKRRLKKIQLTRMKEIVVEYWRTDYVCIV